MKVKRFAAATAAALFLCLTVTGQNSIPRALLPGNIIDELIGEASGERAMKTENPELSIRQNIITSFIVY